MNEALIELEDKAVKINDRSAIATAIVCNNDPPLEKNSGGKKTILKVTATIDEFDNKNVSPRETYKTYGCIPRISEFYIEREGLTTKAFFDPPPEGSNFLSAQTLVLWGPHGNGKTQLALKYLNQNCQNYDLIFYFNVTTKLSLKNQYYSALKKVTKDLKNDELKKIKYKKDKKISKKLNAFIEKSRKKCLIIYDNVIFEDTIENDDIFLPATSSCDVIITSVPELTSFKDQKEVPLFSEEEAKKLISQMLPKEKNSESISKFIIEMGLLPIGLAKACSYIKENNMNIEIFLKQIQEEKTTLKKILLYKDKLSLDHTSLFSTIMLDIESLKDTPIAKEILEFCVLVDYKKISRRLIEDFFNFKNKKGNYKFENAILKLEKLRILDPTENKDFYSIHTLYQQSILLSLCLQKTKKVNKKIKQVYNFLSSRSIFIDKELNTGKKKHLHHKTIASHLESLFSNVLFLNKEKKVSIIHINNIRNIVMNLFDAFLCFEDQKNFCNTCLESSEANLDEEEENRIKFYLANAYLGLNEPKQAFLLYQKILPFFQEDNLTKALILMGMSACCAFHKELGDMADYTKAAIKIFERNFKGNYTIL